MFCNDILQEAKVAWKANFSNQSEYSINSVKELKGHLLPQADLVIGGFPCQDFSLAGKRAGFSAERGRLYQEMARVIGEVKPKAFVAENVYGLLSIDKAIQTIKEESKNFGYKIFHYPVEAQQYGIPQTRKRIFFVALRETDLKRKVSEEEFLPKPSHPNNPVVLNQVFKNLLEPQESDDPDQRSYSKAKFYGSNCQGNKAIDMNKPAPTIRAEHHGNIEFRKLEKEFEYHVLLAFKGAGKQRGFDCMPSSAYGFPDIICIHKESNLKFGIEVKTGRTWQTNGNSIFTEIGEQNVKDIIILFCKTTKPIEISWKRYEDAISQVAITNSPRYTIKMDIDSNSTFFKEMKTTYKEFKKMSMEEKMELVKNCYLHKEKSGRKWWMAKEK